MKIPLKYGWVVSASVDEHSGCLTIAVDNKYKDFFLSNDEQKEDEEKTVVLKFHAEKTS